VGQEFHAFAASLDAEIHHLTEAEKYLYSENMGATAIGSGINVPKGYPKAFAEELSKLLKKPIVPAQDLFAATWDQQGFVVYSSAMKSVAVKLSKIASDLILLTSGPRAGFIHGLLSSAPAASDRSARVGATIFRKAWWTFMRWS
jgi:aspartate ammonia-lyase